MTRTLTMPRLGETMEEGTIAAWLVRPGEAFRRGQPILEVETDKTVVEYPALGDGVLEETLVSPGDVVAVGAPIARVAAETWDDGEPAPAAPAGTRDAAAATPVSAAPAAPTPRDRDPGAPLRATPVARRLARRAGFPLDVVEGTGRRGRIEARDVLAAATAGTVLLVHGFAGDSTAFAALASALGRAGLTVVAPDLPGHGADTARPTGLADLARALDAVAAAAPGPLHLVGHSMGAHLAAALAADRPGRVASLTLIAPAGLGREIDHGFVHGMAAATTADEVAARLRSLGGKGAALSSEAIAGMAGRLSDGRLRDLAEALCGPEGQRIDTLGALARLPDDVPVRALFGVEDPIIPVRHLFALPPRVAIHLLPAGHMPHWDAPAEVAGIVLDAIRRA